jgi:acetylserotonin N-methyltransferase
MTTSNPILQLIDAFRHSKTMFAAVELGIFDGARPAEYKELARLLDACIPLGLLERRGDQYINTEVAERYLRSDSPDTLSGYIRYSNRALYPMWGHLEDALREGSSRWGQVFGGDGPLFTHFYQTDDAMRQFLLGMHGFGRISSPHVVAAFDLSRFQHLVDLGGATGHLADAAREGYPNLKTTVFDLPKVAALFPHVVPGDFFIDPLPAADLYAAGRILHDWSDEKCEVLLAKVYAALPDGGGLLVAEKLLSDTNLPAQMQNLNMLVVTEGRERTAEEYAALFRDAGFQHVEHCFTGAPLDAMLAIK